MQAAKIVNKFLESKTFLLCRTFRTGTRAKALASAELQAEDLKTSYERARPFESIPGPKALPIPRIGNIWRMLPFGTYGNMDIIDLHKLLYETYGPIVKFTGVGYFDQVIFFEPGHAEKMFRNESMWPNRFPLHSLKYYRTKVRKDFYEGQEGLITTNGAEWRSFRTITNPVLLNPTNVKIYLDSVVAVCDDFIERIRYIRRPDNEMPADFIDEINKLSLETFSFMTLDKRLGCLANDLAEDSEPMLMIKNVREAMALMFYLDVRPSLWRIYPTKKWKTFVKCMDYIVEYTNKQIMEKWEKIQNETDDGENENRNILESLLLRTKNPRIPIVMTSDILFAAIDTTSTTMATTLYYLTTNPDKQEKLFQELKKLLPKKDSPITGEILNELKYTRAVIKEAMRLMPTTALNQRTAEKDLVFDNYQIPKGTVMVSSHVIMCRMEEHFKRANEFLPERWLKTETNSDVSYKNAHPFAYLPFGFGQRSCIGKRFAYMEMDVAISKVIRNFKVTYDHEPMTWQSKLITSPSKPLKFKMTERPE
ncbi:hypothetical protein RUM43_004391 [Polyplax serrata]|uniref:Cytochrome P450 n=1 Tax=Polyplax serrata TaxID=468196 RepID=A0AAN8SC00_POLSC